MVDFGQGEMLKCDVFSRLRFFRIWNFSALLLYMGDHSCYVDCNRKHYNVNRKHPGLAASVKYWKNRDAFYADLLEVPSQRKPVKIGYVFDTATWSVTNVGKKCRRYVDV